MKISATVTNAMVRNNNLPDRPTRERARGADKWSVTSLTGSNDPSTEDSQPRNDAPQQRARQTGRKEVNGRALADFRQRRIRQNNTGERTNIHFLRDRQNPGRDQFASLRADNGDAENFPFLVQDDFDVAVRLAFGQARLRQFRVGKGDPWDGVVADAHR